MPTHSACYIPHAWCGPRVLCGKFVTSVTSVTVMFVTLRYGYYRLLYYLNNIIVYSRGLPILSFNTVTLVTLVTHHGSSSSAHCVPCDKQILRPAHEKSALPQRPLFSETLAHVRELSYLCTIIREVPRDEPQCAMRWVVKDIKNDSARSINKSIV